MEGFTDKVHVICFDYTQGDYSGEGTGHITPNLNTFQGKNLSNVFVDILK